MTLALDISVAGASWDAYTVALILEAAGGATVQTYIPLALKNGIDKISTKTKKSILRFLFVKYLNITKQKALNNMVNTMPIVMLSKPFGLKSNLKTLCITLVKI